jgi:hypothetical protein
MVAVVQAAVYLILTVQRGGPSKSWRVEISRRYWKASQVRRANASLCDPRVSLGRSPKAHLKHLKATSNASRPAVQCLVGSNQSSKSRHSVLWYLEHDSALAHLESCSAISIARILPLRVDGFSCLVL